MSKRLIAAIFLLSGVLIGIGVFFIVSTLALEPDTSFATVSAFASNITDNTNSEEEKPEQVELVEIAIEIAGYIKSGDYSSLARTVHPEYNLVISPYATINLSTARCLSADEVKKLEGDSNTYTWGAFYGTTNPIEMNFNDYYSQFIFDRDYTQAPIVAMNTIVATGNALENIDEVFPDCKYVELHYPNSSSDSSDWSTLRLVFEKYKDSYALTAIVHSGWTA